MFLGAPRRSWILVSYRHGGAPIPSRNPNRGAIGDATGPVFEWGEGVLDANPLHALLSLRRKATMDDSGRGSVGL